jgi:hypothetical protein
MIRGHVHSQRLERWLGSEQVEKVSGAMRGWYGPPIALHGVPGAVWVCKDGDFTGDLRAGEETSALDRAHYWLRRLNRAMRVVSNPRRAMLYAGFSSLSDLIAEATAGKKQDFYYNKTGVAGAIASSNSLWAAAGTPSAGAAGSAAAAGRVPVNTTAGAFPLVNPSGGDTTHFVGGQAFSTVALRNLLLCDRIFDVAKTMNNSGTETVSGVPTRYQSTTTSAADYIGGNFVFPEVQTVLANTAHNWTVCTYTDQSGTGTSTIPLAAGIAACAAQRIDYLSSWFLPLEAGDVGIMALTQMQCSALVATGAINFVIAHPIAWLPCPIANFMTIVDGINTAFNLTRIFDSAALFFLDANIGTASAPTLSGSFSTCAG